jgi:hypothetical protein
MRWAKHVVGIREMRSTNEILLGKPERKKLHRHRFWWEDNIK